MKFVKRTLLYLALVVVHFILQSALMILSFASKLIFFETPVWSMGKFLAYLSTALYQVLTFPFVWIFQQLKIDVTWFPDLPFLVNSLFWGAIFMLLILWRAKQKRRPNYQFVKGVSK